MADEGRYRAVVIGSSLGGVEALQVVLGGLRTELPVPVLVAHHVGPSGSALDRVLHRYSRLAVRWAEDGAAAEPGVVYLCPPRQQLRLEPDGTLTVQPHMRQTSLGIVDSLFAGTAAALGEHVLAIVLSGTGRDGRDGARAVKNEGGTVIVQDELTSIAFGMPGAVAEGGLADLVLPLGEIPYVLDRVIGGGEPLPVPELADLEAAFDAGGEMGALIAARNWSATPLGPPERWPQTLRVAATTVLGSRMPMVLCWGPELLTLYNDPYRALIGDRHPELLGQPVLQALAEHAHTLEPMLRSVLGSGAGHMEHNQPFPMLLGDVVRERFCTIGFSPLRDGPTVCGALGAFTDVTAQVQSVRRLRTLHRLAQAADAGPAADASAARAATGPAPAGAAAGEGSPWDVGACERAAAVLAENTADLPFALLYLTDRTGAELHLAAAAGLPAGEPAAPRRLSAREIAAWPVMAAIRRSEPLLVQDVRYRFPGLPPGLPDRALVLPGGRYAHGVAPVVLVLGLNPTVELDGPYREFLDLVADQVGASVLAARRHQDVDDRLVTLAALDRTKTEFFAGVTHEFRAPLALLLAPLERLLADSGLGPDQADAARVAHRNALRLLKMVNTLLELSRLEEGHVEVRLAHVDLPALTADVASVFGPAFERAGVALVVDCPPLGRTVPVDPHMWEWVVLNLVSNALKHTISGTVTVRLGLQKSHVELEVIDTGSGIPESELAHLFTRFHRVRGARARSQEGSGMGLALVRQLVRQLHGSVRVRSTVGLGTTFTVWLPLTQARPPRRAEPADQPDEPDEPGHRVGEHEQAVAGREEASTRRAFAEEAQFWLSGEREV